MKTKKITFLTLFIVCVLSLIARAADQNRPAAVSSGSGYDSALLERLAGFGKLWGLVKFCHPYPATRGIDWDAALIRTLPLAREARSPEAYKAAVAALLSRLKDPGTFVETASNQVENQSVQTSSPEILAKPQPYVERTDDGIAVIVANDYLQFSAENTAYAKIIADFKKAFTEASKSRKILIDLRNLGGGGYSYLLSMAVSDSLSLLLSRDALMPPMRYLFHNGYASQKEPMIYKSELVVRSGGVIRALNTPAEAPEKIVILINGKSYGLFMEMAALQDAGAALLVLEGDEAPLSVVPTIQIDMPDGIRAVVRTAEIVRKNGGDEFRADLKVASDARTAGLEILRGTKIIEKPESAAQASDGPASLFSVVDKSYPEMIYPDRDYRLLALFRFWNVIDKFFPYKDLMDQPWDKTLLEFIPKLEAAGNALEYTLTMAELTARIQDSHGSIINPIYAQYTGRLAPAVQVGFVEGQSIITMIKDPAFKKKGVEVGDIVLAVDGEKVEARRARLKPILPASTIGRQEGKIDMTLLAGDPDKPAKISLRKASGKIVNVVLPRTLEVARIPEYTELPVSAVLPSGFGYIDLGRLLESDVQAAIEKVRNTPGLILDMRGYPVGGSFQLIRLLAKERKPFTQFTFPEFHGDMGAFIPRYETNELYPVKNPFDYKGKIAVLIGPSSQSAAEHTCLGLEAAADVTFIGGPTSGANGNITYAVVPGNIILRFTGLGVRHGDGRQLQRMGIQPHIRIEQTVAGVRSGRDEVLEKAEEFLRGSASRR